MKFYIVTPSYNQLEWLKLCIASVADQAADGMTPGTGRITVHHHVQDACSTDGTAEFLREWQSKVSDTNAQCPVSSTYSFSFSSEKDEGMYDAINKGWRLAPNDADVIAHLNCDEQYLPGALQTIAGFFSKHWKTEVVLADMIVVDRHGDYICHRRSINPHPLVSRFCCAGFTATTFQRTSVIKEKNVFFDTSWKNLGDKVWYNALHRAGCRFAVCNRMVSVFTDTGENLNWSDEGLRERCRYETEFLSGDRIGTVLMARWLGLCRLLKEYINTPPREYALYRNSHSVREIIPICHPCGLWHKRWRENPVQGARRRFQVL